MIILDPEYIEIKFKGEVYKIKEASHQDLVELHEKILKCETKEQSAQVEKEFFEKLGMPSNVYDEISPRKARMIIDEFNKIKN